MLDAEELKEQLMTCRKIEGVVLKREGKFHAGVKIYPKDGGEIIQRRSSQSFLSEKEASDFVMRTIKPLAEIAGMLRSIVENAASKADPNYPKGMQCTRFDTQPDGSRKFCGKPATWYIADKEEFGCDACRQSYLNDFPNEAHRFTRIH